jgi:hypothetical protein
MKKLFLIAFAYILSANALMAQNAKSDSKSVQGTKPKVVPVKMATRPVPMTESKQATTTQAAQNAPSKEAATNTKPNHQNENSGASKGKPVNMKKDGTPDKRYKDNQNVKKDGTPDKRYKENKPSESKK